VRLAIANASNAGESKGSGHGLASSAAMAKAGFMHVVVLFESLFGNTREIAEAIADGARTAHPTAQVACVRVAEADLKVASAADLLVVGGPTHMRGMTSGMSRRMGLTAEEKKDEAEQHEIEPGAEGPGVRDWFGDLPKAAKGSKAAAFDTRGDARMAGGAGHGIARRLRRHGYDLVAEPEGFIIEGAEGPLRAGEPERARAWGASLVRQIAG
jgi:flavodoxin